MFSGIRSMLFGYSDATTTAINETNEKSNNNNIKIDETVKVLERSCLSNETSALLEQTLNAATTKLTEQLLPQSQSIEQLQSSSHQLLPTLIEQHEEDESRKRKQVETIESKDAGNRDSDDDDECFNADSWELLDKPEVATSLNSTVQDDSVCSGSKQMSGILKPSGNKTPSTIQQDDTLKQAQRQKPKVSFETPDLVKEEQEKIETIAPKVNDVKVKSKNNRSNNRKKNKEKKVNVQLECSNKNKLGELKREVLKQEDVSNKMEPQQTPEPTIINKKAPVLNYAAALSMKLDKVAGATNNSTKISDKTNTTSDGETVRNELIKQTSHLKPNGAVKRNRPVSSSSWSSSDEIEAVDSFWTDIATRPKQNEIANEKSQNDDQVFDMDDNESIISSGFSDCDYGYHCMNDYVMRPKKSQNKRRGGPSISSSLLSSMSKRGETDRNVEQQQDKKPAVGSSNQLANQKVSSSSKNIKPRKKKMVMFPAMHSSQFLKKNSLVEVQNNDGSAVAQPEVTPTIAVDSVKLSANSSIGNQDQMMQSVLLVPLPQAVVNIASSSNSGNDSSEIADMDESWFVTPPPCFTGSNKLDKSKTKTKEADRENALIEHPSIYIASTSKQVQPMKCETSSIMSTENKISNAVNVLSKSKTIVLKKVNKQNSDSASSTLETKPKKSNNTPSPAPVAVKKSAEAWGNKFIVTNWNFDEQDDINDFDNLFEAENSSPKRTKKSKAKKQNQLKVEANTALNSLLEDRASPSMSYESDCSMSSPALVGVTATSSCLSLEMVAVDDDIKQLSSQDENISPVVGAEEVKDEEKIVRERKAPIQVRPIEPERQPGWQLRKKRRNRRPLSASVANTCNSVSGQAKQLGKGSAAAAMAEGETVDGVSSGGQMSARSSPTLIDRIGSSIVANLTTLTSGFPASGALPIQARASLEEAVGQSAVRKSNSEFNLVARRRLSKGYMDRQNDCVKLGNSLRRADRRSKIYTTPNGCSVNRKVQTSFH